MQLNSDKFRSGFTMFEIIIVIVIIGILTAATLPLGNGLKARMDARNAGTLVTTMLSTAKSKATSNPRVHCGVYFDLTNRKMKVFFDDNGNNLFDSGTDRVYQASASLPVAIAFELPSTNPIINNVYIFRGDGSVKNSGGIIIKSTKYPIKKLVSVTKETGVISARSI